MDANTDTDTDTNTTVIIGIVSSVCFILLSTIIGLLIYYFVFAKPEPVQAQPGQTQTSQAQPEQTQASQAQPEQTQTLQVQPEQSKPSKVEPTQSDMYPSSCEGAKDNPYFKKLFIKGSSQWTDDERNTVIYNLDKWGLQPSQGDNNYDYVTSIKTCEANKYPSSCEYVKTNSYFQKLISKGASNLTIDERNIVKTNLQKWGLDPTEGLGNEYYLESLQTCDNKYPSTCEKAKNIPFFKNLINKGASSWSDNERNAVIYNLGKWGLQPFEGSGNDVHLRSLQDCNLLPSQADRMKNLIEQALKQATIITRNLSR